MSLRFVLTLHSHLPWVLHHGRWPHGSDWICEAALDSYLPLIAMLDELEQEDVPPPLTIGITPILVAQFAHPSFRDELDIYFAHRLATLDEAPESLRATGDGHLLPLVDFWRAHVRTLQVTWLRIGKDLIAAFRRHADAGRIELISSAATHGFLPLLARDESIRFQLLVGRAEHARHFGDLPRGCWVPECAYRPRGIWQPLPGAAHGRIRSGIEDHLRHAGFQWFFVDAQIVDAGATFDPYSGKTQRRLAKQRKRSPYRGYRVGNESRGRPIYALVRDPKATEQVWSRHGGYPGDGRYLEFHKIRHPGGLKYWSVTDPAADLADKQPYVPAAAREAAMSHAAHFQTLLDETHGDPGDHAIIAPFDTELFGHWWYEGPEFLDFIARTVANDHKTIEMTTPGEYLHRHPTNQIATPGASSWGEEGYWRVWLNESNEWIYPHLQIAQERMSGLVKKFPKADGLKARALKQAARELLLAQASDWPFILRAGTSPDYARRRVKDHLLRFIALHEQLTTTSVDEKWLAEIESRDNLFPDVDWNYWK